MSLRVAFRNFVLGKLSIDFEEAITEARERAHQILYDAHYLLSNKFTLDRDTGTFTKKVELEGKYGGTYNVDISFPKDYPNSPPKIYMNKIGIGASSAHIRGGGVCVEGRDGYIGSWWKRGMNVKSALHLALLAVQGELDKPDYAKSPVELEKKKIDIKGTIYEKMKNNPKINKSDFIKFLHKHKIGIEENFTWEEIANITSREKPKIKDKIISYYEARRSSI